MGIWIRSQDQKSLCETERVVLYEELEGRFGIHGWLSCNAYVIGRYDTKERCIEILDEIASYIAWEKTSPYTMPEK